MDATLCWHMRSGELSESKPDHANSRAREARAAEGAADVRVPDIVLLALRRVLRLAVLEGLRLVVVVVAAHPREHELARAAQLRVRHFLARHVLANTLDGARI